MTKVAICDESMQCLEQAELIVKEYAKNNPDLEISLRCYQSGMELLHDVENGETYRVFILEAELPRISGVDIARIVRGYGISAAIIFISNEVKYAVDAFDLNATHYLMKELSEQKMHNALDRACRRAGRERRRQVMFRHREGIRYVDIRDFMYSMGHQKIQQIVLDTGEKLDVRITATALAEQMISFGSFFIRCGSSYLVNLFYVSGITADSIEMSDGAIIPIPRRSRTEINEEFDEFQKHFGRRDQEFVTHA